MPALRQMFMLLLVEFSNIPSCILVLLKRKYHCTADLLSILLRFNCCAYVELATDLLVWSNLPKPVKQEVNCTYDDTSPMVSVLQLWLPFLRCGIIFWIEQIATDKKERERELEREKSIWTWLERIERITFYPFLLLLFSRLEWNKIISSRQAAWPVCVLNIWPFTAIKICPKHANCAKVSWKLCPIPNRP